MPRTARLRLRRLGHAAVVLLTASLPACLGSLGQAPAESATGEVFGVDARAQRTRIAAQNTESSLLGVIELSADRIIAGTADRTVARNALLWKANAIPAVQRAAHYPDALISYIDEWALILQMRDYFESGPGSDLFGDQQSIAIDALTDAEATLDRKTGEVVDSTTYRTIRGFVRNWAAENPIDNPLFVRPPVSGFAAEVLGDARLGGVDALGRMEELAVDAQQMAQSYAVYTPKVTLWQAQLMVADMLDTATVGPLFSQVDQLALTRSATTFMDELPDLIRDERAATTAEVAALTEASLAAVMELAVGERETVLVEVAKLVRAERSALADDVANALVRTLREGREEAIVVIDHALWRIALMGAALIVLLAVVQYLLFRAFFARRPTTG